MYVTLFVVCIRLLSFACSTNRHPPWAWGRLGHRVISLLAEQRLSPKAKAAIAELLGPGESLSDASLWADQNRRHLPRTAPWHYVDVPLDELKCDARLSGDVSTKDCVVDKINESSRPT
jgi:hypothetical protein